MEEELVMTRDEVRGCDEAAVERFGVPSIVLMENAGSGAARWVMGELARRGGRRVCVLAGPGNNGGDGYVVARHLANEGVEVVVVLLVAAERVKGDAAVNLGIVRAMGVEVVELGGASVEEVAREVGERARRADMVVDAMLGTGVTGAVREPIRSAIVALNAAKRAVVALDVPSGLDCDTGRPLGAEEAVVRAVATVTFAAMKQGLAGAKAVEWTGPVLVVGIGLAAELLRGRG